ncbi:hypothetical protein ES708_34530 [subsurface metagenome]
MRSGGVTKLKAVPAVLGPISEGVVKLERVSVICPACGQQVQAVATDGRINGFARSLLAKGRGKEDRVGEAPPLFEGG